MNTCFAAARLSDRARFDAAARLLVELQRHAPTARVAEWLETLLPALARDLGLPDGWSRELFASSGLPDGEGTRSTERGHHAK